jgi:hypothetical protein
MTATTEKKEKIVIGSRVYCPPAWSHFPQCWVEKGIQPGPDGTVKAIDKASAMVLFDGEEKAQCVLLSNIKLVSQRPQYGPNNPNKEDA